jgi:putative DNA primase/helicase
MGDYVQTANFDLLALKQSTATNDIARLAGARLVMANETRENERLDDQKLKMLVSTEKLTARFMYGEFFEFWPQFKIWLRGNYKPIVTDSSEGAWRRLCLIPFENQVPPEKTDYRLEEKLLAEKEGILAWMIDGCHKWQKFGLKKPKRILEASDVYRNESDLLGEFLDDCCEKGAELEAPQKIVFSAYRHWCTQNGTKSPSQRSFTRQLGSRGIETVRRKINGEISRIYSGLCLTETARSKVSDFSI